jgi:hypothetical protein
MEAGLKDFFSHPNGHLDLDMHSLQNECPQLSQSVGLTIIFEHILHL